jgi:quercetin dioxygenase-like cupin family protein/DNA-binding XRE family transcriptional regulator
VSASLISQIETGKSQPSVSTLYAITNALDIPIEALFTGNAATEDAVVAAPVPGAATAAAEDPVGDGPVGDARATGNGFPFGADRSRRVGPIVPPEGREALTLESGVTWEMLGQIPGIPVEFLRVIYPPGSASSTGEHLMRHVGAEYGFLVSGELALTLGFEEHRIRAGDAFSFPSTTPHRYRNDTDEPAVGVWFVLEDI